jgi:hypothetical protein
MSPSPDDFDQSPAEPALARDRGLRRSRRLTRWISVAAVTCAAALGSLYTHLLPGSSVSSAPSSPPLQSPPASSTAAPNTGADEQRGSSARHENDDGDDQDEHEDEHEDEDGDGDAGAARTSQQAPRPPAQPPAPTRQQPHTTTGAS